MILFSYALDHHGPGAGFNTGVRMVGPGKPDGAITVEEARSLLEQLRSNSEWPQELRAAWGSEDSVNSQSARIMFFPKAMLSASGAPVLKVRGTRLARSKRDDTWLAYQVEKEPGQRGPQPLDYDDDELYIQN